MRGTHSKLTYANVVSTLCLFLLLGGGAYAASQINGRNLKNRSVSGAKIKRDGLTGTEIKESRLGKVPKAVDADTLGGQSPSSYRRQCPTGLSQAADVCYEPTRRTSATWRDALKTCARAQLRLPSAAELALVYDHSGAVQNQELTETPYDANYGPGTDVPLVILLAQNASRQVLTTAADRSSATAFDFRCVTSPSN
jgi:hypothetical protein